MCDVNIFLLCNNEEAIIYQTIEHYRERFPKSHITILDNESTDNSVNIATQLNCNVVHIKTDGIMNEFVQTNLKNEYWQYIKSGWIIIADMDEWLNISYSELLKEDELGTTIISVRGVQIIGNSKMIDVSDINLHDIKNGFFYDREDKYICFKVPYITKMNYDYGAHNAHPEGSNILYSHNTYILKHMAWLGLPYFINKMHKRRERAYVLNNMYGINAHYFTSDDVFIDEYNNNMIKSHIMFNTEN